MNMELIINNSILKRKPKKVGTIKVAVVSPSDTKVERDIVIKNLEREFRVKHHEAHCRHRIIVTGWEELATQNGYPQDVINEKIIAECDIVLAIFRHKLGTPTKDIKTGKIRAVSGTVEELLQALDNSNLQSPLGMAYFYDQAPTVDLNDPAKREIESQWRALERFKKSIQDKMIFKSYHEFNNLLDTICLDLANNILEHFVQRRRK